LDKWAVFANGRAQRPKISAWACRRSPDSPFFENQSAVSPWRAGPLNGRKQGGKPKFPRNKNITNFCRTLKRLSCTKKNHGSSNNAREKSPVHPTHPRRPLPPSRASRRVSKPGSGQHAIRTGPQRPPLKEEQDGPFQSPETRPANRIPRR
jgi:hypothetical protein